MARETWVQSQVESYQRLKKWYLMPPCLTLSIIRYGSRVKWSNPGKGVAPFPTPWCSSYRKGSLRVTLDYGRQLYFLLINHKAFLSYFTQCWPITSIHQSMINFNRRSTRLGLFHPQRLRNHAHCMLIFTFFV